MRESNPCILMQEGQPKWIISRGERLQGKSSDSVRVLRKEQALHWDESYPRKTW